MSLFDRFAVLDIELASGDAVRIENLRIAFEVEKTVTSANNNARVSVWNLSRQTRGGIREKDAFVRLQAGYRGDIVQEVLFTGNASYILNKLEAPDIITEIELSDGLRELRDLQVALSFAPGTTFATVINDIAQRLQIDTRFIAPVSGEFPGGYSYSGAVRGALDEVTRRFGLEWSIQNNELQILQQDAGLAEEAVFLTPNTGLIGAPEKLFYSDGSLSPSPNEPEWRFTSLLNPRLVPGGRVEVDSQLVSGQFIIDTVKHTGDTRGADFISEIEVRGV